MILYNNTLVYAHTHQYRHLEEGLLTYMYDSSVTDHYYLLTDNVGSVTHVVNGEGGTVFDAGYDAWGGQVVTNNVIGFHRSRNICIQQHHCPNRRELQRHEIC